MRPFLSGIKNEKDFSERLHRFGLRPDPPDRHRKHAPRILYWPPPSANYFDLVGKIVEQGAEGSCGGESAGSCVTDLKTELGAIMPPVRYSGRWLYNGAKAADDAEGLDEEDYLTQSGTTLTAVAHILRRWGAVLESDMPYKAGEIVDPTLAQLEKLKEKAKGNRIAAYYDLMRGQNAANWDDIHGQIKSAIWETGCAFVGLAITYGWMDTGPDGIIRESEVIAGGHAVCVCAYDDVMQWYGLANSWGSGWGRGGFAYYPYDYLSDHLLGALRLELRSFPVTRASCRNG